MTRTIPPLDLMWLLMETPAAPTHVGALMTFEKPRGWRGTVREIVEAYRSFAPSSPFDCIPEFPAAGMPRFRKAETYDPLYHVQYLALPEGSSQDEFLRLVTDLHEPMLDRARPLFRLWVIDGVPGDLFAVYTKVHHAIVDGASGAKRIYASLSPGARDRIRPPSFAVEMSVRKPRPPKALVERLTDFRSTATRQSLAIRDVSVGALRKAFSTHAGADPGGSLPFTAHDAPMNQAMTMARSYATLSLPLEVMSRVGRHFGATLNDVAVTLVDEGVHRYLRQTGRAFPHRLVAMCPMSLREEGDTDAATKASAMFVHLGDPACSVAERIGQVVAQMAVAKQELRSMSKDAAMIYAIAALGLAELRTVSRIGQMTRPLANLVISNVPGGTERMYVNRAPMVGTYPVSAVAAAVGLNATLTSYAGQMQFGFIGNGASMYALPDLARHVADAHEELTAAAGRSAVRVGKRGGRAPRARRKVARQARAGK